MKIYRLLNELERAFFRGILDECTELDRGVLTDQMRRINMVRRYDDPVKRERQTILYWKSWFRVRRDFPIVFPWDRAEERVAEAVVTSADRVVITAWMLAGAIGWVVLKPISDAKDLSTATLGELRVFPDRTPKTDQAKDD
jgi:hypothetical protein